MALPPMKAATECNSLAPYRHLKQGEKVTSRHHLTTYVLRFLSAAEPSALDFGPIVDSSINGFQLNVFNDCNL